MSHGHILRNLVRRAQLLKLDDTGGLQLVTLDALGTFKGLRLQVHGLTGVPPAQALGYLLLASGAADQAFALGLELPSLRPAGGLAGEVRAYALAGQLIEMTAAGDIRLKAAAQFKPPAGSGKAWARKGDSGTHGGTITSSAARTWCEGKLVARVGDTYTCASHGAQLITGHSTRFKAEGQFIARHGDTVACGATLIATATKTFD